MAKQSRRQFLKTSLARAAGITTAASLGLHLGLGKRVLAQSSSRFSDNKALVCVFLFGGCDSYNLLVPTQAGDYQTYKGVRQNLAYSPDQVRGISPNSTSPYSVGMPTAASALAQLFDEKKLSLVANIGPMTQPVTKAMIKNQPSLLPPQLFSHNDQQGLWQSGLGYTGSSTGWGGRMADLIADTSDPLSMNLSINGNNLMQAGTIIQPFSVDASGPEQMAALDPTKDWNARRIDVFSRLLEDVQHPFERAYASKLQSAAQNNERLIQALSSVAPTEVSYNEDNNLAQQLKMVARLIASQQALGQPRQIYFVGMGGWDTHDNQSSVHPQLLQYLGHALQSFQQDIDARGLAQGVTTFTMSEFGRTLTSNGDGTDHGWGGHQMVMGDAVKGGEIFGRLPSLALNSNDDMGDGRMVPELSVEQMGADLARWFGLSEPEINTIFMNLNRFDANALSMFKTYV
ncbi:DUF1501 domain-containing protein [Glaciecola siphonariae]|uniref:DUF1501 domain-containing protein n=1 Tax=Glaciecola siphonariae TaxID=521012 RepID=A0ABV9LZX4_9ALTE